MLVSLQPFPLKSLVYFQTLLAHRFSSQSLFFLDYSCARYFLLQSDHAARSLQHFLLRMFQCISQFLCNDILINGSFSLWNWSPLCCSCDCRQSHVSHLLQPILPLQLSYVSPRFQSVYAQLCPYWCIANAPRTLYNYFHCFHLHYFQLLSYLLVPFPYSSHPTLGGVGGYLSRFA